MAEISKQIILFESEKGRKRLITRVQHHTTPSRGDCLITAGQQGQILLN